MRQVRIIMAALFLAALVAAAFVLFMGVLWLCAEHSDIAAMLALVILGMVAALGFYKAAEQMINENDGK